MFLNLSNLWTNKFLIYLSILITMIYDLCSRFIGVLQLIMGCYSKFNIATLKSGLFCH